MANKKKIKITEANKYDENIDFDNSLTLNAIIKENKPVCPICKGESNLSTVNTSDYELVKLNNNKVVLFRCKCYNCGNILQYCSDIKIEGTNRYSADGYEKIKED